MPNQKVAIEFDFRGELVTKWAEHRPHHIGVCGQLRPYRVELGAMTEDGYRYFTLDLLESDARRV